MNPKSSFTIVLNKKIREEKVISQVELARIMDVSTVAITKWLNGGTPDLDKLPLLCKVLNVTPNELFGYDTPYRRKLADELFDSYEKHPQYKDAVDSLLELK